MKTLSLRAGAAARNPARKREPQPAIIHGIKHL
jgi:hypothetical protein